MNTNGSAPSNRYQFLVEIWKELSLSKKSSEDGKYMHIFRVDNSFESEGDEHDPQGSIVHSAPTAGLLAGHSLHLR